MISLGTQTEPELWVEGAHHLAYISEHIAETHRFWTETMGLRYSWAITNLYVPSTGDYSPHMHVFYELGDHGNVAYFAIKRETLDPGPDWVNHPGRHYALQAASEDDLPSWRERLVNAGVSVHDETAEDGRPALAFLDPEGIRWKITAPARSYSEADRRQAASLVKHWIEDARQRKMAPAEAAR